MNFQYSKLSFLFATLLSLIATSVQAFDEEAAKALAKKNDCFKCHNVEKTKKGPAYKKVAEKYKGKEAEAETKIYKHLTTGPKVKLEDGSEEEHRIIDTKDKAEIKNLIQWIIAQ